MTVSNGSNPRQAAKSCDQADPSGASANPAAPKFPMPDEPFWPVTWAIAFVMVIAYGVLSGMTNPVDWLLAIVFLTPLNFLLVHSCRCPACGFISRLSACAAGLKSSRAGLAS